MSRSVLARVKPCDRTARDISAERLAPVDELRHHACLGLNAGDVRHPTHRLNPVSSKPAPRASRAIPASLTQWLGGIALQCPKNRLQSIFVFQTHSCIPWHSNVFWRLRVTHRSIGGVNGGNLFPPCALPSEAEYSGAEVILTQVSTRYPPAPRDSQ